MSTDERNYLLRYVNLNGTSWDGLAAQVRTLSEALRATQKALGEAFPHGRDFQSAPSPEAHRDALLAHEAAGKHLYGLVQYAEALAMDISSQERR